MSQDINTIIDQLAEIDSASAKIMQKSQVEKTKYSEMITEKKHAFNDELEAQINSAVEEYKKSIEQENQVLLEKSKEDCQKALSQLDKNFDQNGEAWVTEIFNNIVKE